MKNKLTSILLGALAMVSFSACDDLFEPAKENLKDVDQMYEDQRFAQGFLLNVYRNVPPYYDNSEYATDDAVTNENDNALRKLGTGAWTSQNNPLSQWERCLNSIHNLNIFIANAPKVHWAEDEDAAKLFELRLLGEAHGLRALFTYYLLRNHAGITDDGTLTGVPVFDETMIDNMDYNIPRSTFVECVAQAYADLDIAEKNLPLEYANLAEGAAVPAPFDQYTVNPGVYNRVLGNYCNLAYLFNGQMARAVRARIALLAASPAFQNDTYSWAQAADATARVLDKIGGTSGLDPKGVTYYCNTAEIDALADGKNLPEVIWSKQISNNQNEESANFPPSLYGKGRMNPTQNLVDAFPMANGYPISEGAGNYDAANPYANRDPRLAQYIIFNGAQEGVDNTPISTGSDATTADGLNKRETSTRTGYYMKKRLRMDVNCNPSASSNKNHYEPVIRYTEMFLNYAEAANEAWGPTNGGSHGYSAYDVIKAIRKRALGDGVKDGDPYLESIKGDQIKMRELIRNERRLELCFESFRFWDLRRWKANLNEPARGMEIRNNNHYTELPNVEARSFAEYMYYGPIPNSEILKFSNLEQNKGW